MKKIASLLLALVLVLSLAACGGNNGKTPADDSKNNSGDTGTPSTPDDSTDDSAGEAELTLKFVEQLPDGHIMADTLYYFADQVRTLSNGSIDVEVYTGGVLGDDTAMSEAIQLGTIDVCREEFTTLVNMGAKQGIATTLPYVFRDRDHYWAVADSDVGKDLIDSIQADGTGMVGLCLVEEGARHFFANKPLNGIEDLNGMKLRVQDTEMWAAIVRALGASPTPMSFSELYSAINSGTVEGAEQPLSGYVTNNFYEVAPYLILDGHVYPTQAYVISEITWNKMTDEQKAVLQEAAQLTAAYNREHIEQAEADIMASLADLGVTVVEVADKTPWVDAMQPVYEAFGDADTLAMLERIQNVQ